MLIDAQLVSSVCRFVDRTCLTAEAQRIVVQDERTIMMKAITKKTLTDSPPPLWQQSAAHAQHARRAEPDQLVGLRVRVHADMR